MPHCGGQREDVQVRVGRAVGVGLDAADRLVRPRPRPEAAHDLSRTSSRAAVSPIAASAAARGALPRPGLAPSRRVVYDSRVGPDQDRDPAWHTSPSPQTSAREFGNGPARRLRKDGLVPGVVYQPGGALAGPVAARPRAAPRDRWRAARASSTSTVGDSTAPRSCSRTGTPPGARSTCCTWTSRRSTSRQEIEAPVQVVLVGTSVGVRDGGVLDQPHREVVVSALPDALPDHLEFDVSELAIGDSA